MKTLITILILFSFKANATTYYFSASGNDANNGTSTGTAWQTINKLNSIFSSLQSGDQVLFRRGDSFYGTILPTKGFTTPVIFGAYGIGANPIITGFTTVSAWTNLGSNIWESTSAVSTLNDLNVVTIGGINTAMGRHPNSGYFTYQSHIGNVQVTSSSLNSATTNWTGADVVMKTFAFVIKRATIQSHSGGTLTYTAATGTDNGNNGYGLFIENDPKTLDVQNEWYYNPSTKKIRIYSTSSPVNVKIASLNNLVYIINKSNFTFDGIDFIGSNTHAFYLGSVSGATIQNCNFDFHLYGIWGGSNHGSASSNFNFNHNTVNHINGQAISLQNEYTSPYIGYNTFNNCGVLHGMFKKIGSQFNAAYGAIHTIRVANVTIEYNVIDSTGYNGIWVEETSNNAQIHHNEVSKYCMILTDGAGIYTWIGPDGTPSSFSRIYNNIVHDGVGDNAGTTAVGLAQVQGIYLDENTRNVEVYNNTCFNNPYGGMLSNASPNCNFHHNTFYNNGVNQARFGSNFVVLSANNIFTNNILVSRLASQDVFTVSTKFDDVRSNPFFSTIDNNYYARPIDDNVTFFIETNQYTTFLHYNLAQWKTYMSPKDASSQKSPLTISNLNDLVFHYNATSSPVVIPLSGTYIDMPGTSYAGSITLQPYTSAVLIFQSGGGNIAPSVSITSPANGTTYTPSPATVVINATATDTDGTITSVIFYQGVSLLFTDFSFPYSYTWTPVGVGTYSLTAKAIDNNTAETTSAAKSITVTDVAVEVIKIRARLKVL